MVTVPQVVVSEDDETQDSSANNGLNTVDSDLLVPTPNKRADENSELVVSIANLLECSQIVGILKPINLNRNCQA